MVERLGFCCDVANNGVEAVAAASAKSYEFVLMDLSMPMMSGCKAARKIREVNQNGGDGGRTPTIYGMSSSDDAATRRRCSESGMEGVLCKPIEGSKLRQIFHIGTTSTTHNYSKDQVFGPTFCMHNESWNEEKCVFSGKIQGVGSSFTTTGQLSCWKFQ
jgi:hypothetical protein